MKYFFASILLIVICSAELVELKLPRYSADYLMVSNEPENIKQPGLLFSGDLKSLETERILYYHKNVASKNIDLSTIIDNVSNSDLKIQITKGVGGPDRDGLFAGHAALRKFLELWNRNEQSFIVIPKKTKMVVLTQVLKPQQIGSAFIQLTIISSGNALLSIIADDETSKGQNHLFQVNAEENSQRIGGVFTHPQMEYVHEIDVNSENHWYYRIGDDPFIVDYKTKRTLKGNYGLQYQYKLKLKNSGRETKYVECFFVPNGGAARGIFVIDGKLLETAVVKPNSEEAVYFLRRYVVPASAEIETELITLPQAGSNYPVTLVFKVR